MVILEKHNENSRRQALAGYNVNVTSDNNINIVPNLSSSGRRSRFSSNYTELTDNDFKDINEEVKKEDFSQITEIEGDSESIKKEKSLKRNTFSTISSIDPAQTEKANLRLQEVLNWKEKIQKSPKKNLVGFKIPESEFQEEEDEKSEYDDEKENKKKLSVSWRSFNKGVKKTQSHKLKKPKTTTNSTFENMSSSCCSDYSSDSESENEIKNSDLVTDSVKIFKVYFPHNNVNEIFETIKNIELIKLKRFQRKKNTSELNNKTFWNFSRFKNAVGFIKKAKHLEKSLRNASTKCETSKDTKTKICETKKTEDNVENEVIQKKILRRIRESSAAKNDSILHQILKSKQK